MTTPHEPNDSSHSLQQRLHITNQLLEALASHKPLTSLAQRMSSLCGGAAFMYRSDARLIASAGTAPSRLIWQEVHKAGTRDRTVRAEIGRWHMIARRVSLHGGMHIIALASHNSPKLEAVAVPMLDTAEKLLSAVYGISFEALQENRRDRERILLQLLTGIQPGQEHHYWAMMEKFWFTPYERIRVLDIANFSGENITDSQLSLLSQRAQGSKLPLLIRAQMAGSDTPESAAAIVPDSDLAESWIVDMNEHFLVGLSEPFTGLAGVHRRYREAETALHIAKGLAHRAGACTEVPPVFLDRVDLTSWVLSQVNESKLAERSQVTLEALHRAGVYETVLMFLACNQNVPETANRLFIHPNTVRYRLARAEKALGASLMSPFTLSNLTLCMHPQLVALITELTDSTRAGQGD